MNTNHKQRLLKISFYLIVVSVITVLILYALSQNINLYYTPAEIADGRAPRQQKIRIGGMVKTASISHGPDLKVDFIVTDYVNDLIVKYKGILPDLFREGQGVVALGNIGPQGIFYATEILAKHDEKYMPKEAILALEGAQNAN